MTLVYGYFVQVVETRFLEFLPKSIIKEEMFLGNLLGPGNKPVDGWVTARCRSHVIMSGTRNAAVRVCPEGGRNSYFATGARYLSPEPSEGKPIYESQLAGFVIPDEVAERAQIPQRKGILHEVMKVRIPASDGLGDTPGA